VTVLNPLEHKHTDKLPQILFRYKPKRMEKVIIIQEISSQSACDVVGS